MVEPVNIAKAKRIELVAHHEPWLWPVIVVGTFAMGWWAALHALYWVALAAPALAVAGYVAACGNTHRGMSCLRCWRAEPPASSARFVAQRHHRALWWAHVTDNWGPWLLAPFLVVLFIPSVVGFGSGVAGLAVVMSSTAWAILKHKQLRRWCPLCPRHGGGDDGGSASVPPPRPVLTGSK